MNLDRRVRPIQRLNLVFSTGAVAASVALASPGFAASVALGAAVEALSFRGLALGTQRLFAGDVPGAGGWVALFVLRFGILAGAIVFAIRSGAEPVGLLIGLSMILPAGVVGGFWVQRRIGVGDPGPPPDGPPPPDDPSWEQWDPWLARERDPDDADRVEQ